MNKIFQAVFLGYLFQFYFGGPLIEALFGKQELQEKIADRLQWIGVVLATIGLMYLWNLPVKPAP